VRSTKSAKLGEAAVQAAKPAAKPAAKVPQPSATPAQQRDEEDWMTPTWKKVQTVCLLPMLLLPRRPNLPHSPLSLAASED
jgi:hypothetical protein